MRIKKFVEVKCAFCKEKVLKELKEYRRQTKNGKTEFYCDLSCAARGNVALMVNATHNKENPQEFNLRFRNAPRKYNLEFSPFKLMIRKTQQRIKSKLTKKCGGLEFSLTFEILHKMWEKQRGVCPYTGINMTLQNGGNKRATPEQASLDRIDSNKGYTEDNVEFVCLAINYAKNGFSKEQIIDFFSKIAK